MMNSPANAGLFFELHSAWHVVLIENIVIMIYFKKTLIISSAYDKLSR